MDFKRLAYFAQIAELGSLSRAAAHLRIAQPSLSRQMRLLEDELGVKLFSRHRRGMQLTREGDDLKSRITGPMRQIEHALKDVRSLSAETGGSVALGMPPSAGFVLAGPLARRVVACAPEISLRVIEGYIINVINWLERGDVDAAILYKPSSGRRLLGEPLLAEDMVLAGPADSTLAADVPVDFRELGEFPLVTASQSHGVRSTIDELAAKTETELNRAFVADSLHLMKEYVEHGLGYTVLPYSAIRREVEAGRLKYAPIQNPKVTRQLVLLRHPGCEYPRATAKLETLIKQEIAALVQSGKWPATLLYTPEESA